MDLAYFPASQALKGGIGMANDDTLLDKCVREALRLGFGPHVQHFADYARAQCGSLEAYFQKFKAPPKKNYVSRQMDVVSSVQVSHELRPRRVRPPQVCRWCGCSVPPESQYVYYCGISCYRKADRHRHKEDRKAARMARNPARPCDWCGKLLPAGTSLKKRYCCEECRIEARRERDRKKVKSR